MDNAVPDALEHTGEIAQRLAGRRLALLLDYDGTLTPIVRRPEEATLDPALQHRLEQLAGRCTVAIVSGRDRRDVQQMVQVDSLIYAGSHGFDIQGPGLRMEHQQAQRSLPDLDRAEAMLRSQLQGVPAARVERKRFAIAVHFREVSEQIDVQRIQQTVQDVQQQLPSLRTMGGKKIFELQPDVPWDKGQAVLWLVRQLGLDSADVLIVYIGDDVTDEHAFRALAQHPSGLGIRVGEPDPASSAAYHVQDTQEVGRLLEFFHCHTMTGSGRR